MALLRRAHWPPSSDNAADVAQTLSLPRPARVPAPHSVTPKLGAAGRCAWRQALQRQPQAGHAARAIQPILPRQRAALAFRDLAAQHQPDTAPAPLGGKERNTE